MTQNDHVTRVGRTSFTKKLANVMKYLSLGGNGNDHTTDQIKHNNSNNNYNGVIRRSRAVSKNALNISSNSTNRVQASIGGNSSSMSSYDYSVNNHSKSVASLNALQRNQNSSLQRPSRRKIFTQPSSVSSSTLHSASSMKLNSLAVSPDEDNHSDKSNSETSSPTSQAYDSKVRNRKQSLTSEVSMVEAKVVTKPLCCDKCDGKHETDNCPYYKKNRETHPDAQRSSKHLGGFSTLPGASLRSARVVRQPGDGSCLFHSISYGLRDGSTANSLRSDICHFISKNPNFKISDTPLSDWVKWDSGGSSCREYASRMSRGAWGGGIEMSCAAHIKGVNVHVYEQCRGGYKRISAFDHPTNPENRPIVRVLYCGGVHYDALVV